DLDTGRDLEITGSDLAGALGREVQRLLVDSVHADDDPLQVQDDVDDVFLDPFDGGELVLHTLDLDAGDGRTRDPGEQRPPHRVAQGVTEPRLERLDNELRPVVVDGFFVDLWALDDQQPGYLTSSRARRSTARCCRCRSGRVGDERGLRCAAGRH